MPIFLLFTLGNITLNSQWVKGRIAGVLEQKTGEYWEIGTVTCAANGVLHVYALECQLGDGRMLVEHISVKPNYGLLVEGRLRLADVHIERPVVTLTDKWILGKLETKVDQVIEQPLLASHKNEETPELKTQTEEKSPKEESIAGVNEGKSRTIEVKPNASTAPVGNHSATDFYESWIRVSGGKLKIVSKQGDVLVIDGVNAELPTGGKDLTGALSWGGLSLLGRELVSAGSVKIGKNGPLMSVKETEVDFFGVTLQPDVYLGRSLQGPVFHIDMQIPEQRVEEMFTHLNLTVDLSADKIAGRMQLTGLLSHPSTWRGFADVRALGIQAKEGHRGTIVQFDSFHWQSLLDRGVVQSPNIQLRGEDVSLMSNGVLHMNGEGYGVVRVIALPEKSKWINKIASGSGLFGGMRGAAMRPYETKDLYYIDVKIDGNILDPMIQLDQKTDWQPLWPAIIRLQKFIKEERLEEGF